MTSFHLGSAHSSLVVLILLVGLRSYGTIVQYQTTGVTFAFVCRVNSTYVYFHDLGEVLLLQDSPHCSSLRKLGDVIARTPPYAWLPTDTPIRTRFFLVHEWFISEETRLVKSKLLHTFSTRKSTYKSGTRKDHLMRLRSPTKRTFKCLILKTPLWCDIMSRNLKNPKEQKNRKKRMLSNQPKLTRITPTVLLGSWGWQPIEDITSPGTDFETYA